MIAYSRVLAETVESPGSATALLSNLNLGGVAALLIAADGRVVDINAAALRILSEREICLERGRLASRRHEENGRFDAVLDLLLCEGKRGQVGGPVVLPHTEGRPLLGYSLGPPLEAQHPGLAVVVLVDLNARARLEPRDVMIAFRLTPAEGRLACLIAEGESLQDAALILNLTYGTVRGMLARLYEKTETHRQGELVALLSHLLFKRPQRIAPA